MEFDLFVRLNKFPFIFKSEKHDALNLRQNINCRKCTTNDCFVLAKTKAQHYTCKLGYDNFTIFINDEVAILNGLILSDNNVIKKSRIQARAEYCFEQAQVFDYINQINEVSNLIDNKIRKGITESFTLFHDVRTSYAIAFSILETIVFEQEGKDFYDKLQKCSRKIIDLYESLDLVNSQLELIDVMVNPNAITQGSKRESNFFQLTHKLTKLFDARAKKRELKFRLNAYSDIPNKLYHESIKLIPMILIENAIKYSEVQNEIHITFEVAKDKVKFSVSSYGIGVPENERISIFKKHFRGSNTRDYTNEGIGMGLYTANRILEKHNGEISYSFEEKGRGYGFNIFTVEV